MKLIYTIILTLIANISFSQGTVPGFTADKNKQTTENSTLGGNFISGDKAVETNTNHQIVTIKKLKKGDFVIIEINKNDKKNYALELINSRGEIALSIANFNASAFKIIKKTFDNGNYTVFLTDCETKKTDVSSIML